MREVLERIRLQDIKNQWNTLMERHTAIRTILNSIILNVFYNASFYYTYNVKWVEDFSVRPCYADYQVKNMLSNLTTKMLSGEDWLVKLWQWINCQNMQSITHQFS